MENSRSLDQQLNQAVEAVMEKQVFHEIFDNDYLAMKSIKKPQVAGPVYKDGRAVEENANIDTHEPANNGVYRHIWREAKRRRNG